MTAAQKTAKAKFKQAIAYRQKTGVSLKEAFAHIYGKKVGAVKKKVAKKVIRKVVKKKAAPKKVAKKKLTRKDYDKRFQADKPSKRTSASGNTYYEYRENRSDRGKLLGIGKFYDSNILKKLESSMDELDMANGQIILHRGNLKMGIKDLFTKKLNQDLVKKNIKLRKELITHIRELKKLI